MPANSQEAEPSRSLVTDTMRSLSPGTPKRHSPDA